MSKGRYKWRIRNAAAGSASVGIIGNCFFQLGVPAIHFAAPRGPCQHQSFGWPNNPSITQGCVSELVSAAETAVRISMLSSR